jgi:hypothetical protein
MTRLATIAALGVTVCLAQPIPGRAPVTDELKAYLQLSDSQVQALQQIRQQEATAVRDIAQQMQQRQTALRQLLQAGNADAAAVGRAMLEIEALRRRVADQDTAFRGQAANLLNEQQKTRLKTLDDASKLLPEIRQAQSLNLLAPPTEEVGPGFAFGRPLDPRGLMGPGGPGPRFGPRE